MKLFKPFTYLSLIILFVLVNGNIHDRFKRKSGRSSNTDAHCPISSSIDSSKGFLSYPINMFTNISRSDYDNHVLYNCSAVDNYRIRNGANAWHFCSTSALKVCPLHSANLKLATKTSSRYKHRAATCGFVESLNKNEIVNIYIYGGSVTHGGTHTTGCCCTLDKKCPTNNECTSQHNACGWVQYFGRWADEYFNGKVKVHNFAEVATTSGISVLNGNRQRDFKSSDIIFLDFSANDYHNIWVPDGVRNQVLLEGLEACIRKFLVSSPATAVILLEYWRLGDPRATDEYSEDNWAQHHPERHIYRNISRYYKIPFWSYDDAFFGTYTATKQALYAEAVHFEYNEPRMDLHSPWYIHLLYADLMSDLLLRLIHHCGVKDEKTVVGGATDLAAVDSVPAPISAPLHLYDLNCRKDSAASINILASDVLADPVKNALHPAVSMKGWDFVVESKGKAGWIATSSSTVVGGGSASFTIALDTNFKLVEDRYDDLSFTIRYLRTYQDAGVAQVFICESYLGQIDALWPDPSTTRLSLNSAVFIRFCDFRKKCGNLKEKSIRIVHKNDGSRGGLRGNHKFKILGVSVCMESDHCMRDFSHKNLFHNF